MRTRTLPNGGPCLGPCVLLPKERSGLEKRDIGRQGWSSSNQRLAPYSSSWDPDPAVLGPSEETTFGYAGGAVRHEVVARLSRTLTEHQSCTVVGLIPFTDGVADAMSVDSDKLAFGVSSR
jgi:hypothetical protein